MTRSKRAFAELYAAAQKREPDQAYIDELCQKYSVVELIYEIKKLEESVQEPPPVPEQMAPEPPPAAPPSPRAPSPDPVKDFLVDIWSRLSS
jgi:hypothetical protein